jgi:ABC-2 type transport system permease protein
MLGRQISAEWIKLRSLRSTWVAVAVGILGIVVQAVTALATSGNSDPHEASLNAMSAAEGISLVIVVVLGVIAAASEYSQKSIITTYTVTADRRVVLAAKAIVVLALGVALGLVAVPVARLVAVIWFVFAAGSWDAGLGTAVHYAIGNIITFAGWAVIGVMIGTLVRSPALGVGIAFGVLFVVDSILGSITVYSEYSLTSIAQSLSNPDLRSSRQPLFGSAIALLTFYVMILAGVTASIESRRDV